MKKNSGFTLVELIVVIAILGILAGVAVPVYSGYIKKANQAADNVLLGAVNTALQVAYVENGAERPLAKNSLTLTGNDTITGIAGASDAVKASFVKFFAGNENTALKSCKAGEVVYENGLFRLPGGTAAAPTALRSGTVTLPSGKKLTAVTDEATGIVTYTVTDESGKVVATYKMSETDLVAFEGSVFNKMGVNDLLAKTTTAVNAATAVNSLAEIATSLLPKELLDQVTQTTAEDGTVVYDKTSLANALVLYTASKAADPSEAKTLAASFTDGTFTGTTRTALTSKNYATLIPNVALAYGAISGYVGSVDDDATFTADGKTYNVKAYYNEVTGSLAGMSGGTEATTAVLTMLENYVKYDKDGFGTYLKSDDFSSDLAGYLGAMGAMSSNTDQLVDSGAVSSGYGGNISEVLNGIFGGN